MASKFTYLRVGLATSLSLALGGSTAASVFASPAQPVMPSQVLFQDDDGDDDGGAVSGVWDPTPRPVSIHTGTIAALGDDVAELNSLVAPDGSAIGSDDRARSEYAYTPGIPMSLDGLTDDDHVIIVELSELNDRVIAYGHIGGVRDANGSLVVNLVAFDGDDDDDDGNVFGVAILTPNASNPGSTDASIFISGSSLGDDVGSRVDDDDRDHDNDGRDDDDADGDGIRDDDDDDDDDDGRLDDDDDDDDDDGRTDDDNDDDRDDDGADDDGPGGDDDGFDDDGPGGDDDGGIDDDGPGGDDDGDDGSDDDGGDDVGDDDGSDDDFDDNGGDDDGDDDGGVDDDGDDD